MLKELLFTYLITTCAPDISNILEHQVELHPALGVVVTLQSGTQVAYPVYPPVYVQQCDYFVKKDTFNLTFKICYGTLVYILGNPSMFKQRNDSEWVSMDNYPCKEGG